MYSLFHGKLYTKKTLFKPRSIFDFSNLLNGFFYFSYLPVHVKEAKALLSDGTTLTSVATVSQTCVANRVQTSEPVARRLNQTSTRGTEGASTPADRRCGSRLLERGVHPHSRHGPNGARMIQMVPGNFFRKLPLKFNQEI